MSDADRAYEAALALIEDAWTTGETGISFDTEEYRALTRIPPEIAALTRLQSLSLPQTGVTDLSSLSPLTGLHYISLDKTGVSDLSPLSTLTGLQSLSLDQTRVTDLTPLSPLTGLQSLSLNRTSVTDLSPLSRLTGLQALWLNYTNITDLAPLSPLTNLESLSLAQTGVTDLTPLSAFNGLIVLALSRTGVTDLTPLSPLSGLAVLFLDQTGITDLTPLSPLSGLRDLYLDGTTVTDLRPLCDLHKLGTNRPPGLSFRDTPATARDTELARLAELVDPKDRAEQTLAYLRSLPPWPEPYTPRATPDGSPPQPIGATQPPLSPHPETTTATPVDEASTATKPLPQGLPRRITATRARHVLQDHSQDLREQCQFVTDQINHTLAQQIPAKPNDPEQLAAWTHLVNTLELSRTAIMSLHEAIPDRTEHRPVTDDEANHLKHAFEAAIAKLQEASAYIDGPGEAHGRTYAGLLKIGVCSVLAAPIALISAQPVALIGAGLYTMFYGKGAALEVLKAIGVAPAPK
jgi:hypothetical protein